MSDRILVVGYGNALRTDDGLGWHIAERLVDDDRLDGVEVLRCHQLTPELAFDVSDSALVVLVDASTGSAAGTFTIDGVERAGGAATTWSHHLSPSSLVALAHDLYGRSAEVVAVSCGVQSLDVGDQLSPVVAAALPRMVDAIVELVASHSAERGRA